ncbi:hypothetical protein BV20DRAFT_1058376 [Pilatotrama ljubarskyi]|nr:hypothetical protein BV20DRAFT_1058376 [Pilatotrama ljubarskyi]
MASFPTAAPTPEDVFAHAHDLLRVDLHARLRSCEVAVFEGRTGDPWCEEVLEVLDLMVGPVLILLRAWLSLTAEPRSHTSAYPDTTPRARAFALASTSCSPSVVGLRAP